MAFGSYECLRPVETLAGSTFRRHWFGGIGSDELYLISIYPAERKTPLELDQHDFLEIEDRLVGFVRVKKKRRQLLHVLCKP